MPFFVRAGKCLPVTATEVMVDLHRPPQHVFDETMPSRSNYFRFRLGPDVAIALGARAKAPGERDGRRGERSSMSCTSSGDEMEAYERLIGDAMMGDATLFARQDSVEAQWRIVDPILGDETPVHEYGRGTWGPSEAAEIAESVGGWHDPIVPKAKGRS